MRQLVIALVLGSLVSMVGPAAAQDWMPAATLELSQGSVAAGIGFSWGRGTLTYGGRQYPVKVLGLSLGEAGFTWGTAKGIVFGLKTLEDFSGIYVAGGAGVTIFGGGEAATMKNENGVVVEWTTSNVGVNFKLAASGVRLKVASAADCVSIGTPKPALSYTYQQSDSVGGASEFTDRWEEFSKTGSRLLTSKSSPKGSGVITSVNRHRVVDDVLILDSSTQTGTDAGRQVDNSASFQPGVVADPAYRACAGRTWPIPSVMATNESAQGRFSAATPAGTLTITAIRESVTVPAGRFDTVHYTRVTGESVDEYWKSIEHGVTVKRTHTMPGGVVVTATLHTIK